MERFPPFHMSYYKKKTPIVGSLTTSVSLALVVHAILLLLVIGFTIERVARPKSLTDAPDSLNSVLIQETKTPDSKPAPIENSKPPVPEPIGSPDGAKIAVAIPTTDAPVPAKSSEFQAKTTEEIPTAPPPPRPLGNPAPPKVINTAPAPVAAPSGGGENDGSGPTEGAKSGVVAFTNVKGDSAKRIVYVIDGSGSMAVCLPFIRAELLRSVARLDDTQSFQIVVFREPPSGSRAAGTFFLNPRKTVQNSLLAADDLNKSILRDWLETVQPLGRSTPLAGIESALALQPDLIFLLSRGIKRSGIDVNNSNKAILDRLEELNPVNSITHKRRTVIKALQFIDDDPSGLMQAIGKAHGDASESYKVIPVPERYRNGTSGRGKDSHSLDKN